MYLVAAQTGPQTRRETNTTTRLAVSYTIDGDLRFLSHRDELRMFVRALVRAGWPLAYSAGFNPRPRVVLPLPRSVGLAAACQWAVVTLREPREPAALRGSLGATLPHCCRLLDVWPLPGRRIPQPTRARYELQLEPAAVATVGERLGPLLAARSVPVCRSRGPGKATQTIDIRPYIENLELDATCLRWSVIFAAQRTARPDEVLSALGLPAADYNHRVRRVAVEWDLALAGPHAGPANAERTDCGHNKHRDSEGS